MTYNDHITLLLLLSNNYVW